MFLRMVCCAAATGETGMTDAEHARKLDELDRLLYQPSVPLTRM